MIISYWREYFNFDNLRINFDSGIEYTDLRRTVQTKYRDSECVMEIKVSIDTEDDYIEKIVPYPTARFSKYSRSLLVADGLL